MISGQAPAKAIPMTSLQKKLLQEIVVKYSSGQQQVKRAKILLLASEGQSNSSIKRDLGISLNTVKSWRRRWLSTYENLLIYEDSVSQGISKLLDYHKHILELLRDLPRSGAPKTITLSQEQQIIGIACEAPEDYGIAFTDWTHEMLAYVAVAKGVINSISSRQVGRILKKKPNPTP